MAPFRRALLLAAILLFSIIMLYHQHSDAPDATTRGPPKPTNIPPKPVRHAKQQQQIALGNLKKLPLRLQLAHQFPYDVTQKFPQYIWQTWKFTPASHKFEEKFRQPEASWSTLHPTFIHEVITDQVAINLIHHLYAAVPKVLEAYNAMPLPILKADFFRYLILLARGGIYSDIDTFALKPALEWLDNYKFPTATHGLVIGVEADPDRPDWKDWYSRRIQFCQWTIQSKPGHPVLRDIVAKITEETLKRKREGKLNKDSHNVVEWTGPATWTDSVFDYFNEPEFFDMTTSKGKIEPTHFTGMKAPKQLGDVIVLPITGFSPGVGHSGAGEPDDPMACVQHGFEGSWKPEAERMIDPAQNQDELKKQEEQKKREEQKQQSELAKNAQ